MKGVCGEVFKSKIPTRGEKVRGKGKKQNSVRAGGSLSYKLSISKKLEDSIGL